MEHNQTHSATVSLAIFARAEEANKVLDKLLGQAPERADDISALRDALEENIDVAHALMAENKFAEMIDLLEDDMMNIEKLYREIHSPVLPLTPGLLVSMALRYDYSFSTILLRQPDDPENETLEEKQIRLLFEVFSFWQNRKEIIGMEVDLFEELMSFEMTGNGNYRPENENVYKALSTATAWTTAVSIVDGDYDE